MLRLRQYFGLGCRVAAVALVVAAPLAAAAQESSPPNVVLLMAQDLGYSDLGCFGGEVPTPHLDRLAAEGMRFTKIHSAGAAAPTAAALLTGIYPHEAGVAMAPTDRSTELPAAYQGELSGQSLTVAEAMGKAGYRCIYGGEWLLGSSSESLPTARGFDQHVAGENPAQNMITSLSNSDQPTLTVWNLGLVTSLPYDHELALELRGTYLKGWSQVWQQRLNGLVAQGLLDPTTVVSFMGHAADTEDEWQQLSRAKQREWISDQAARSAQVVALDQQVGTLLEAMNAEGMLDNALVIFVASHTQNNLALEPQTFRLAPYNLPSHLLYQGALNMPFIAWGPGRVAQGLINDSFVGHAIDLMPTLLQAAEADYLGVYNGREIAPPRGLGFMALLQGKEVKRLTPLFWEHQGNKAMRFGNIKLVYSKLLGAWEMYNLHDDPGEHDNLAATQKGAVRLFSTKYDKWALEVGAQDLEP